MNIVKFPKLGTADIAAGLRGLADLIENGIANPFNPAGAVDVETVVWIARDAQGGTCVGALGRCPGGLDEAVGIAMRGISQELGGSA